jgi:hypothetical protein
MGGRDLAGMRFRPREVEPAWRAGAPSRGGPLVAVKEGAHELRARRRVEVQALPAAVERVLGRGLRLVTVSALLAAGEQHPAHTLTNTRRQ